MTVLQPHFSSIQGIKGGEGETYYLSSIDLFADLMVSNRTEREAYKTT
jgi:hypothetical protein